MSDSIFRPGLPRSAVVRIATALRRYPLAVHTVITKL
jgi:hypothetical protein